MNKNPKISVITSVYNGEEYLEQTILSVLDQSYNNIEYIVVDGNSTDRSPEIIKKYGERLKFWVSEPDTGIYNAWNKALKHVSGEWIVFIGADDYWKNPDVITTMIPYLKDAENKKIKYVYGKIEHITLQGKLVEVSGKPWVEQKSRFTYIMNIGHSGSFHHASLFEMHGQFNDSFKITGDYEFLLREFKNPDNDALFVNETTLSMREGGVSASLDNRYKVVKESKKARKLNGITSFSKELAIWEIRILFITVLSSIFGQSFAAKTADLYRKILGKEKRWSN
ncbi:glycosyltransferase family 2 protein [Aquimarina addita]|uniref:Glycosyltransferase family 2 protein n=1 Tax=Aquimarina addita TaxID=870485 RepID=A0ABP7XAV6_9FLAO